MNRFFLIVIIFVFNVVSGFSFRDFFSEDFIYDKERDKREWNLFQTLQTTSTSMFDDNGRAVKAQLTKIIQSEGDGIMPQYEECAEILLQLEGQSQISLRKIYDNASNIEAYKDLLPKEHMKVINDQIDEVVAKHNGKKSRHIAYYESKDGEVQMIQNDNLFIFSNSDGKKRHSGITDKTWKNISPAECLQISERMQGNKIEFNNKFPPFLVRWISNDNGLYSPGVPKHETGVSLSDRAAKSLLKGAVWGHSVLDARLLGYTNWGDNYILFFSFIPAFPGDPAERDYRVNYMVMYDSKGKVLDSVQYYQNKNTLIKENDKSFCMTLDRKPWQEDEDEDEDEFKHVIRFQLLPQQFLMTSACWNQDSKSDCPSIWGDDFLRLFPLSSMDYNLWKNVFVIKDRNAEFLDQNEDIANLIIIDHDSYLQWLSRPTANPIREAFKDFDRLKILEPAEESELRTEFMEDVE